MTPRLRALVLSAGLGTRLRPLTDELPKPLVPVCGHPILAHTLGSLAAAGCEAVAVNLHHRGEQIRRHFGAEYAGIPLTWSPEPVLLGTLGALLPLRDFFAPADLVLIINGDSLCRWPLARLVGHHLAGRRRPGGGWKATLLLAARADPRLFGGGVETDRDGNIVDLLPDAPSPAAHHRRVFAGAHVLSPELLELLPSPEGSAALSDIVRGLYVPLLAARRGCLGSLTTTRRWHDLGTPRRLLAATLDWAGAGAGRRWISKAAEISEHAALRRCSVEAGCRVAAGAVVEDAVLLPGATVGEGGVVRGAVLGPGATVPAGGRLEERLLTAGGVVSPLA
jgi:mannose-1-phosphate guanylyltransferase